jgi:hypothetical protein
MVGPVTNSCGNEAKIDVPYEGIADMDAFAAEYTRKHQSELFDIEVLAMYCVAFRSSLIAEIGNLDEQCVICSEEVFIHHWGRASFGRIDREQYDAIFAENKLKFEAKWRQKWQPHRYRSSQQPARALSSTCV